MPDKSQITVFKISFNRMVSLVSDGYPIGSNPRSLAYIASKYVETLEQEIEDLEKQLKEKENDI